MALFDAPVFDLFRNDEGDAAAAQRRADKFGAKADSNQAKADSLDPPSEGEVVAAPLVASPGGGGAAVISQAPQWGRVVRSLKASKTLHEESASIQAEQAEQISQLAARQARMAQGMGMLVEKLREKEAKDSRGTAFLSDTVMSALSGFIAVINVSDVVQFPAAKATAAALQAAIASDSVEGSTETWLRVFQLLSESLAYYDPLVGLQSIIGAEGGGLLLTGSTSSTTTWLTDSGF